MVQVVLDDIETWPTPLKVVIDNLRTATVIIPTLILLGWVYSILYIKYSHTYKQGLPAVFGASELLLMGHD